MKLIDPSGMRAALGIWSRQYPLAVALIEAGLPIAELMAGLALLYRRSERMAARYILCMVLLFVVFLAAQQHVGASTCGCFGATARKAGDLEIAMGRDAFLVLAGVFLVWQTRSEARVK